MTRNLLKFWLYLGLLAFAFTSHSAPATAQPAAELAEVTRIKDVVYGYKYGMALTMDVFTPQKDANGIAVIWMVSGGWRSTQPYISLGSSHISLGPTQAAIQTMTGRGYTVFAVVHSSQPRFNIPEILQDVQRAVRFIRYHAADYQIDAGRIGIAGASSGGHLALMQAMAGDMGNQISADPIERVSSRVQAVACFYPPTDFLNYGGPGEEALGRGRLHYYPEPFAFHELDPAKRREVGRQISPLYHVTADDPPTFIIHGDQDQLVPIQQSEILMAALKAANVPAELMVKRGARHGWFDMDQDIPALADWFDKYLLHQAKN